MSRKSRSVLARVGVLVLTAIVLLPSSAVAQAPWERAANNLALSFTGPLARAVRPPSHARPRPPASRRYV